LKQSVREELSQWKDADVGNPIFQSVAVKEKEPSKTPPEKKKKQHWIYCWEMTMTQRAVKMIQNLKSFA